MYLRNFDLFFHPTKKNEVLEINIESSHEIKYTVLHNVSLCKVRQIERNIGKIEKLKITHGLGNLWGPFIYI